MGESSTITLSVIHGLGVRLTVGGFTVATGNEIVFEARYQLGVLSIVEAHLELMRLAVPVALSIGAETVKMVHGCRYLQQSWKSVAQGAADLPPVGIRQRMMELRREFGKAGRIQYSAQLSVVARAQELAFEAARTQSARVVLVVEDGFRMVWVDEHNRLPTGRSREGNTPFIKQALQFCLKLGFPVVSDAKIALVHTDPSTTTVYLSIMTTTTLPNWLHRVAPRDVVDCDRQHNAALWRALRWSE